MTIKQLFKQVLKICKETEEYIEEQKEGKTLEKPILNDLITTKKAMAYEDILELIRKYNKVRKEG